MVRSKVSTDILCNQWYRRSKSFGINIYMQIGTPMRMSGLYEVQVCTWMSFIACDSLSQNPRSVLKQLLDQLIECNCVCKQCEKPGHAPKILIPLIRFCTICAFITF